MMATLQQDKQHHSDNTTLSWLQDLFQKTLYSSQDQRNQAEKQLSQFMDQSGIPQGLMSCLCLLSLTTTPHSISQSCAIFMKNQLKHYYDAHSENHSMIVPLQSFRQSLLDFYIYSCPPLLKKHIYPSFTIIIDEHYPTTWIDLLLIIHKNLSLQTCDSQPLSGLIDILIVIIQVFNSSSKKQSKFIFTDIYPILLGLFPQSPTNIKKSILKAYYKSIQFLLPKELFDISNWMECIVKTILLNSGNDLMFYKMKKWAFHCLDRLFCRYGTSSTQYLEFSKQFKKVFATPVIKLALEQIFSLQQLYTTQDDSILHTLDRITACCADIISESIGIKSLWTVIEPQYQHLVSQVIFPRLCYSNPDDDDPLFIFRQLDLTDLADEYSSNHSLLNIYLEMIKKKKSIVLEPILSFIQSVLTGASKPEQKDGSLVMLGYASDLALKVLQRNGSLENWINIMLRYIRECQSYPFLQARALWVLEQFGSDVTYSSIEHVHQVLDTVVKTLLSDLSPSVRIQAANTLNMMLVYEEVRPLLPLPSIVQVLLELTNQYSSADCLVDVLENFVKTFSVEMIPFTSQLIGQLSFSLMKALGSIEQASKVDSEDGNSEYDGLFFTAMGLFKTMDTLVIGLKGDDKGILDGIESVILEPIIFVLHHEELEDFHEEILELLDAMMFIQKKVSPLVWKIFPMIYTRCSQLSFCDMIPVLDNYISFGDKDIVFGQDAMQIWLTMLCKVMTASECDEECFYGEADRIGACQIMEALLLHGRGLLSNRELELFLSWVTKLLFNNDESEEVYRSTAAVVYYLEVILNIIIYDPKYCIEWLKNYNLLKEFFSMLDKDKGHFIRVHDKRLLLMGAYQILLLCIQGAVDKSIAETMSCTMMGCLQYATSTFAKAVEDRNKLLEDNSDDDEEEEYETDDDENEDKPESYVDVDDDDELYRDSSLSFDEDEDNGNLEEELYFETPLDHIDIYSMLQRDIFNDRSFFVQHPYYISIQQVLIQGMPKPTQ